MKSSVLGSRHHQPLRILLVGNYAPDGQYSMHQFTRILAQGLRTVGIAVEVIQPRSVAGRITFGIGFLKRIAGYVDKCIIFPIALRLRVRHHDCVHIIDHSNAPYLPFCGRRPVVLTCHDLFAVQGMLGELPDQPMRLTGRIHQKIVLHCLRNVKNLTCVAQKTLLDFERIVGTGARSVVISNALSPLFHTVSDTESDEALAVLGVSPNIPYFLHVGGNQFYKNRVGVVRLFEKLGTSDRFSRHRLILAGKAPDEALRSAINASSLGHRIDLVIGAADSAIRALYNRAEALLFISLSEGFGWPILEAQACGCPVVTSDREPMLNVSGGAALFVSPEDIDSAAAKVLETGPKLRHLRAEGFVNSARYSIEQIVPQYVSFYRDALR